MFPDLESAHTHQEGIDLTPGEDMLTGGPGGLLLFYLIASSLITR